MNKSFATAFLMTLIQAQNWSMFAQPEAVKAAPEVVVYSADYCPACGPAIERLRNEGFSVRVSKNIPAWVELLPTITWKAKDGKWKYYVGLTDAKLKYIRESIDTGGT